jgi:hypothetical protein
MDERPDIVTMIDSALPRDFGKGWMTQAARDLARVAAGFGGYDTRELARRLTRAGSAKRMLNAATVERVLDEMYAEASRNSQVEVETSGHSEN